MISDNSSSQTRLASSLLRRNSQLQTTVQSIVLPQVKIGARTAERCLPTQIISTLGNSRSFINSGRARTALISVQNRAIAVVQRTAEQSAFLKQTLQTEATRKAPMRSFRRKVKLSGMPVGLKKQQFSVPSLQRLTERAVSSNRISYGLSKSTPLATKPALLGLTTVFSVACMLGMMNKPTLVNKSAPAATATDS